MMAEETLVHTLPAEIVDVVWRWSRTQYRDDLWVEPTIRTYLLKLDQRNDLRIQISCKELDGNYQVTNNLLSVTVKEPLINQGPCEAQTMDNTYLNDLARVVNYVLEGERLILELGNNAGYMYFSRKL